VLGMAVPKGWEASGGHEKSRQKPWRLVKSFGCLSA
jgi:hypothetical protein